MANTNFESASLNFIKNSRDIIEEDQDEFLTKEIGKSDCKYYLKINLKIGEGLVAKDFSGYSDPYVKFIIDGKTLYKSKTQYKNLNPIWNEHFQIPLQNMEKSLLIQVYDHDFIGRDDLIGSTWIDLGDLVEFGHLYDFKRSLENSKSVNDELGSIKFSVEAMERRNQTGRKESESTDCSFDFDAKSQSLRTNSIGRNPNELSGVVMVEVVKCSNLKAMDADGYSDPYVKISLGKQRFKSKVKYRTLNPTFKENFNLKFHAGDTTVNISVWDRDSYKRNDFIGSLKLELTKFEPDRTHKLPELVLRDKKGEQVGQIELVISVTGINTSDMNPPTPTSIISRNGDVIMHPREKFSIPRTFENLDEIGHLSFTLVRAENLTAADLGGKSDPFAVIELGNERLRTHTVYKTLHPEWNKTFDLDIHDLSHVLYVTIYDEDSNGRAEFLGKIALPLNELENHFIVKIALKDATLEPDARGSVVIKSSIHYNPIRAALAMFQPGEELLWKEAISIDRQLLQKNVQRTMDIVFQFLEIAAFLNSLFTWKYPLRSVIGLIFYVLIVYYFEIWMIPMFASCTLLWGLARPHILGKPNVDNIVNAPQQSKKTPDLGIKDKVNIFKETLQKCQNGLDLLASSFERVGNVFHWKVPFSSKVAIIALLVVTLLLYLIPLRAIVLFWGLNKFTKRLIKPNYEPSNELLDFLSRLPSKPESEERRNTIISRKRADGTISNSETAPI